jgi:hypothetical protein
MFYWVAAFKQDLSSWNFCGVSSSQKLMAFVGTAMPEDYYPYCYYQAETNFWG